MPFRRLIPAALLAFLAGCDAAPRTAVIALHGIGADERYLEGMADSLAAGPRPIRVEIFNSGNPGTGYREALERAREVVALPGLAGVVGHRDSRGTLVVGPIYQDAGFPLVVPNATSRAISDIGPLVFRMVADDVEEGAFLARVVIDGMGARRVTLFHVADEFGIGIRDGTLEALDAGGMVPVDVVEYGLRRQTCPGDFEALVDASLVRGTPDAVILAGRTDDVACIVRLVGERAPEARFLAADGVNVGDTLVNALGPYTDRVRVAQFWSPFQDSASAAFAADYLRRSGQVADQGSALRWDAVRLLVAAIREVGGDPDRVADWLESLGHTRPPFHGVTGDIAFGPGEHPLRVVDPAGHPVPR